MRIVSADKVDALPPDIAGRFCEEELAIAANQLMAKCVKARNEYPEKIVLFVSPLYGLIAQSVLNCPKYLFTLNLLESNILDRHALICMDIHEDGPNARWGIEEPGGEIVVSAGERSVQAPFRQEVTYSR